MTPTSSVRRAGQVTRLRAELGEGRGEQHGAAHHGEGILALGDENRWRVAAHALQGRQQLGDLIVALAKRALEDALLLLELGQAQFDGGELRLAALDQGRGLDEARIEAARARLRWLIDVALQGLRALFDVLQLELLAFELLLGVVGAGGRLREYRAARRTDDEQGNAGEGAGEQKRILSVLPGSTALFP